MKPGLNLSETTGMSIRQALRSRFKGAEKTETTSHVKCINSNTPSFSEDCEDFETFDGDPDCQSIQSGNSNLSDQFKDLQEKAIFEEQLTQLQEQLVAIMIENQSLKTELKVKDEKLTTEFKKIQEELKNEKKRNEKLEKGSKTPQRKSSSLKNKKDGDNIEPAVDIASDLIDEDVVSIPESQFTGPKKSIFNRMYTGVIHKVYEIIDDFTEEIEFVHIDHIESDPLTAKRLKKNIKRFGRAVKPYYNTSKGIFKLLSWKTPLYTLIVFLVYMYMVYKGWLLQSVLACLVFRLFIQFLIYSRDWNIQFNYFYTEETDDKETDDNLGLSDKFNLVVEVATKVQNALGQAADSLEKVKSLFLWRHPEASNRLLLLFVVSFIITCLLPLPFVFQILGFIIGFKLFIINNIYNKFPRIKKKYDTTHQIWLALPTDFQFEKKNMIHELDRYILKHGHLELTAGEEENKTDLSLLSNEDKTFCRLFSLPKTECPLPGWQGGKMCTLINRDKSITAAFKSGKLYLTRSFLCFERSKTPSPKNIIIPLVNIGSLAKAKPYSWLPGDGMSIEVTLANSDQSYIFGGLMNRDETFDMISEIGMLSQLPWATGLPLEELHMTRRLSDLSRKIPPQHFKNFSLGMVYDDCEKK